MRTTEQSTRGKWIRLFGLAALGVILIIGAQAHRMTGNFLAEDGRAKSAGYP